MTDARIVEHGGTLRCVERDLAAHVMSLRRKLQRAARRGEQADRLQARIRSEEALLARMQAFRKGH